MAKFREKIQWKNQTINFVAIALGVYLAFAVNKCQVNSDLVEMRQQYLIAIRADIETDKAMIEDHINTFDTLFLKTSWLLDYSEGKSGTRDSLNFYFSGITSQTTFNTYNFTFQSVVSSGRLSDLSDIELIRALTELYNGKYSEIRALNELGQKIFQQEVIPRLFDETIDDEYLKSEGFKNLVATTRMIIGQQIEVYKNAQSHIDKVLMELDKQLAE